MLLPVRIVLIPLISLATACASPETPDPKTARPESDQAGETSPVVELVGEGVISTESNETFPTEDPRDGTLWFSRYVDDFDTQTIVFARRTDNGWDEPQTATFSGTYGDRAPRFAPDGSALYFTSNRPVDDAAAPGDLNIWVVTRRSDGSWNEPELVPAPVSSLERDMHNVVTANGNQYVASYREGTLGRADIFLVQAGSTPGQNAIRLEPPVNDEIGQPDLYVSPDETWMILVVTDHPGGFGGDDLFLSRFVDGEWREPENLGEPINSDEYEYGPSVSADGRYLYFTSHRRGSGDVFRVALSAIGLGQ